MNSLLNTTRPLVFCPGCAHERVARALDLALQELELPGNRVAIVSDIGCSGLFDTFFNTHAFHGLHGRALTYATGLKMASPDLTVIVVMGDGGMGIGGAHVLSSYRRNLDLTLLVLNNFNYGMTGGQCSVTTPDDGVTSSGFLNALEPPLDICSTAVSAGAPWVARAWAEKGEVKRLLTEAIAFNGFSLLEIQGECTGRYSRKNSEKGLTDTDEQFHGRIEVNQRKEYGEHYRECAAGIAAPPFSATIETVHPAVQSGPCAILLLGAAGQRVNTAGELLCLAAISSGMFASQKSDYPITVLRGHSVSEVILSPNPIGYTGIRRPDIIVAIDQAGVDRRKASFAAMDKSGHVLCAQDVSIPDTAAQITRVDFTKEYKIPSVHRAMFSLGLLAARSPAPFSMDMLETAITYRFSGSASEKAKDILTRSVPASP